MDNYETEIKILRKYFHGLTDEQFNEDVSKWPLNNVLGAIKEAAKQEWISVDDDVPSIDEAVWIYADMQIIFGQYGYDGTGRENYFDRHGNPLDGVTHWMTIKRPTSPNIVND